MILLLLLQLEPLEALAGSWEGAGKDPGGEAAIKETWEPILGGSAVQSKLRWSRGDKTVHESTTIFTYDSDRGRIVARVFFNIGEAHEYVATVSDNGTTMTFVETMKESKRTRFQIRRLGDKDVAGRFEIEDASGSWVEAATWSVKKSP